MRGRAVPRREAFARHDEGCGVGAEVEEELTFFWRVSFVGFEAEREWGGGEGGTNEST